MNKIVLTILATAISAGIASVDVYSQAAFDAAQMGQNDLRGTARYMSMAGAYGALGGDLSSIAHNPAGIGVYRYSDVGVTLGLNLQSSKSGSSNSVDNTVLNCNNAAYVGVFNFNSETLQNFNWGFSYNRAMSFNRRTAGRFNNLKASLSNYIAGETNRYGYFYDPDNNVNAPNNIANGYSGTVPWLSTLAFYSFAMSPNGIGQNFQGLYGDGTTGYGTFETVESGGVDEYNITFGGNLYNTVYWGFGIGITDISHTTSTYYSENLEGAYLDDGNGVTRGTAYWDLQNYLRTTGSGWNFKMGFIVVPTQALRLGFSFETPTYYQLTDQYYADCQFDYSNGMVYNPNEDVNCMTPDGEIYYQMTTPWKFQASAATIIASRATLSFEYQYTGTQTMSIRDNAGRNDFEMTNTVRNYLRATNTFKVGAELRVTPKLSVRAGYSYETSPVKDDIIDNQYVLDNGASLITSGTMPAYNIVRNTQYYTAGIGYKFKNLYADLAFVHKSRTNDYHAFSPAYYQLNGRPMIEESPTAVVKDNNNQIVLSVGIRF